MEKQIYYGPTIPSLKGPKKNRLLKYEDVDKQFIKLKLCPAVLHTVGSEFVFLAINVYFLSFFFPFKYYLFQFLVKEASVKKTKLKLVNLVVSNIMKTISGHKFIEFRVTKFMF